VGLTPDQVAIRQLLLGWVTVCGQVNQLSIWPNTEVNSAFHPSEVGKLSTSLHLCIAEVKAGHVHLCGVADTGNTLYVVTLCMLHNSEIGSSQELYTPLTFLFQ